MADRGPSGTAEEGLGVAKSSPVVHEEERAFACRRAVKGGNLKEVFRERSGPEQLPFVESLSAGLKALR